MHGSGGLEFNDCAHQRFSLHGVDLTKFDGGGARDKEVITSIPRGKRWKVPRSDLPSHLACMIGPSSPACMAACWKDGPPPTTAGLPWQTAVAALHCGPGPSLQNCMRAQALRTGITLQHCVCSMHAPCDVPEPSLVAGPRWQHSGGLRNKALQC